MAWNPDTPRRKVECGHPERKHYAKGMCCACYVKSKPEEYKEKKRAASRKYAKENRGKIAARARETLYGIGSAEFIAMNAAQDGLCAICFKRPALCVDHCHTTGVVRGLLCQKCNAAIGMLADDVKTTLRAAAYLDRFSLHPVGVSSDPSIAAALAETIRLVGANGPTDKTSRFMNTGMPAGATK